LKLQIRLKWYGWKARRQRLFYNGKELTSTKLTLAEVGLTYGSSLVVALKADPSVTSSGIPILSSTAVGGQQQFGGPGGQGAAPPTKTAIATGSIVPVVQLSDGNGIYAEELAQSPAFVHSTFPGSYTPQLLGNPFL
jgi:hypothetical protein